LEKLGTQILLNRIVKSYNLITLNACAINLNSVKSCFHTSNYNNELAKYLLYKTQHIFEPTYLYVWLPADALVTIISTIANMIIQVKM